MADALLDDPAYQPKHPPVAGEVPDVVAKWGPASQLRWFARFGDDLKPQKRAYWNRFYVCSEHHRGDCCWSCIDDQNEGYGMLEDDDGEPLCCCRALDAGS